MDAATDVIPPRVSAKDHRSLLADYTTVRSFTMKLAAPLSAEDMTVQSMTDASPAKWHLAHTSWFFETFILRRFVPSYKVLHPAYELLFNSYYNGVGPQFSRPDRGVLSRPTVEEIEAYRAHVDEGVTRFIESATTADWQEAAPLIELGLNHEQQHQELLLTDLKHAMSLNPLYPVIYPSPTPNATRAIDNAWISFDGGVREVGFRGNGFAFDNEGPSHEVLLQPYRLQRRPITNAEYIEFIADGGYRDPLLWLSDGWSSVKREGWAHPIYWHEHDSAWYEYTLAGLKPVDMSAPVTHVSFFEANAFASWAGARLPTEFEWEAAAQDLSLEGHYADSGDYQPRAAVGTSGLVQMFGDVWEWTGSSYGPYPGFKPAAGAVGEYNGKFMVSQLVLRGGSCATPLGHIRASYRNFFYPAARWQFSGIRLASDA